MKYYKEELEQTYKHFKDELEEAKRKFAFWGKVVKITHFSLHGFASKKLHDHYLKANELEFKVAAVKKELDRVGDKIRKAHEKRERKNRA